MEYIW